MLHWLVTNGLWPALIAAVLTFIVGAIGGWLLGIRRAWRRHAAQQDRIIGLLNTETPGGLADVVMELKRCKENE